MDGKSLGVFPYLKLNASWNSDLLRTKCCSMSGRTLNQGVIHRGSPHKGEMCLSKADACGRGVEGNCGCPKNFEIEENLLKKMLNN